MAETEALERITALLPEEQREPYLKVLSRLRQVPEDDEYLLILEAIGFTSLILEGVPQQVQALLSASASLGSLPSSSTEYLVARIGELLREEISQPNHRDFQEDFVALNRTLGTFHEEVRSLNQHLASHSRPRRHWWDFALFLAIGLNVSLLLWVWQSLILVSPNVSSRESATAEAPERGIVFPAQELSRP